MRLRHRKWADEVLNENKDISRNLSDFVPEEVKEFPNLEIGSGCGGFILALSALHPENRYLGVEINRNAFALAVKKGAEVKDKQKNFLLLNAPIEKKNIGNFFSELKSTYEYNSSLSLSLFTNVVNANLSISHFDIIILEFPEYFECINKTLNDIVNNEKTNFTRSEIFYLAIMGAASVDCDFVIKDLIRLYLLNYGEESWITNGLIVAPEELKSFGKIFNIIAFQPWKLKVDDINALGIQKNLQSFIQKKIEIS